MKILNLNEQEYKVVHYFGIELIIQRNHQYVFVDKNGSLNSSNVKPEIEDDKSEIWIFDNLYAKWSHLGKVDLEGRDWSNTLVKVD